MEMKEIESDENRREYLRVEDAFPVEYRRFEEETLEAARGRYEQFPGYRDLKCGAVLDGLRHRLGEIEDRAFYEGIMRALYELDTKLDRVLGLLDPASKARPGRNEAMPVVFSASGMCLTLEEGFVVGDLLELTITLPVFPPLVAKVLAQVQRVRPKTTSDGGTLNEVAMEFVAINEQDREEMVRYTFQKQRKELRMRKAAE